MLGTEVCATELRRRVSAGNRGVCNRAEEKGECIPLFPVETTFSHLCI